MIIKLTPSIVDTYREPICNLLSNKLHIYNDVTSVVLNPLNANREMFLNLHKGKLQALIVIHNYPKSIYISLLVSYGNRAGVELLKSLSTSKNLEVLPKDKKLTWYYIKQGFRLSSDKLTLIKLKDS